MAPTASSCSTHRKSLSRLRCRDFPTGELPVPGLYDSSSLAAVAVPVSVDAVVQILSPLALKDSARPHAFGDVASAFCRNICCSFPTRSSDGEISEDSLCQAGCSRPGCMWYGFGCSTFCKKGETSAQQNIDSLPSLQHAIGSIR